VELKRLGKYEIIAKIGEGGMGEVYKAHDPVLGRDVAIKTMSARAEGDELRERFHREARSAAQLNHPNIITIYDFGEEQGRMYIAMELLEGQDLKDLLQGGPPLGFPTKLDLMEQICDGLAFAHAKQIVHRDLKPGNIHVQRNRQVKIMDFGLARVASSDMTRAGLILGTPHYMSPEQVSGRKATARSDVFSLGSVFYELLSGRKSFDADTMAGVLFQVMQLEPEPLEKVRPEVPPVVAALVRKAMDKDPEQRFADAGQMREALRQVRESLAPATGPVPEVTVPGTQTLPSAGRAHATPQSRTTLRGHATPIATASRAATVRQPEPARDQTRTMGPPPEATLAAAAATQLRPKAAPRSAPPRRLPALPGGAVPARRTGVFLAGTAVAVAAVAAGVGWAVWPRSTFPSPVPSAAPATVPPPPASPAALASPEPGLGPALQALQRSLEDKDHRGVVSQADAILARDAGNPAAQDARQQALTALRESERTRASLRKGLAARDTTAASQALTRLVQLDPRDPELPALTAGLNELLAAQEQARRAAEARRAAATPTPQAGVAPPSLAPATLPPATVPPATTAPAATLPPVTAPPATRPVQSEAAARQAIRGVLDEYRAAFETRNADALRAVQPGVDYEGMKEVFATVTGYTVRLDVKDVVVKGDSAQAHCVVTYNPVPKPAGKIRPVPTVFHLRRSGELWLIERLERK
jgi:serine/threonine-protein kinase